MVNILLVIGLTAVVTIVGGGIGYFVWLAMRPKKMNWNAMVYQLGDAVRPYIRNKEGQIVSKVRLSDLKPYTKDVIEKIEEAPGMTIYRLVKLNKPVPAVTNDTVDYWGEKEKIVSVLLEQESCTLLKKGYNRDAGVLFDPMPHDRINMIKSEVAIRKSRLNQKKDILQAITPWIVTGICMLALLAVITIAVNGFVEMSENIRAGQEYAADKQAEAMRGIRNIVGDKIIEDINEENQKPDIPPLEGPGS